MQPEKPNHLRLEPAPTVYSDAMPDIRQALEWISLDDATHAATAANRPIFAVLVAPWSTGAHLVSRDLEAPETRALISEHFVPVLIDPVASPALAVKLAALARYQGGSGSLPIIAILSPQLNPVFALTYSSPEHRQKGLPSTPSLLQSIVEQWESDPASFDTEWERSRSDLPSVDSVLEKDQDKGGFNEYPRQLHPYVLVDESSDDGAGDPWLLQTLSTLWDNGIRDQLEASFHPQTRNANWTIPFFEKIIPQNAAMAFVYARAAKQTNDRELRSHAQDLVRVVLSSVLKKTDVISAESQYYTWTSTEAFENVSRENLQPVSLVYNIQPSGSRLVLSKVRTIDDLASLSYEPKSSLERRYLTGNAELLMHRRTRPAPRPLSLDNPAWRAETWRWLILAVDTLDSSDQSLVKSGYLTWLAEVAPMFVGEADFSDVGFQTEVSTLISLLVARAEMTDPTIEDILPPLLERVTAGIQHWQQADTVDSMWLHRHAFLPSIASTLRAINSLLPEGETLPPLG